jgi:hypothetical protein
MNKEIFIGIIIAIAIILLIVFVILWTVQIAEDIIEYDCEQLYALMNQEYFYYSSYDSLTQSVFIDKECWKELDLTNKTEV